MKLTYKRIANLIVIMVLLLIVAFWLLGGSPIMTAIWLIMVAGFTLITITLYYRL